MKRTITVIILAILLFTAGYIYIQQERVKRHVIAIVTQQVEKQTGWQAAIGKIELSFPFDMHVESIRVQDNSKPLFIINDLHLKLTFWELLRKHLAFDSIQLGNFSLFDLPKNNDIEREKGSLFPWEAIPGYIKINHLQIDKLHIEPKLLQEWGISDSASLFEKAPPLQIKGQLGIDRFNQTIFADLTFLSSQFLNEKTQIAIELMEADSEAHVKIHLTETDRSFIANHFQLPKGYTYQGFIHGTFPQECWKKLINNIPLSDLNYCSGDFQLSYSAVENVPKEFHQILGNYGSLKGDFQFTNQSIDIPKIQGIIGHILVEGKSKLNADRKFEDTSFLLSLRDNQASEKWNVLANEIKAACSLTGFITTPTIAFKLDKDNAYLQGTVDIDPNHLLTGEVAGKANLSQFDSDLKGDIEIKAKFSEDAENPHSQLLTVYFHTPLLTTSSFEAKKVSVEAKLSHLWTKPYGFLQARCDELSKDAWSIYEASAETVFDHKNSSWPFSLSLHGVETNQMSLTVKGSWHINEEELFLSLSSLQSRAESIPITLNNPATLRLRKGLLELSPLSFNIDSGHLFAEFDLTSGYTHGTIGVDDIPIQLLRYFQPSFPAKGLASAHIELSETPSGTFGDLQINLNNVSIEEHLKTATPINASLKASLGDGVLEGAGLIVGLGTEPVELFTKLPVTVNFNPLKFEIEKNLPFSFHALATTPLGSLLELLSWTTNTTLTGDVKLGIDLSGTLASPKLKGSAELTHGSCELFELGLNFHNITAKLDLHDSEITLKEFNALESQTGKISGKGSAKVDAEHSFPFNINLYVDQVALARLDSAYSTASGQLNISGNNKEALLEGKLVSNELHVIIPDEIAALNHTLDVKYVNQSPDVPPPTVYVPQASSWPISLNLELEIPNKGMIVGEDWKSEWKGKATVEGTTTHPLLVGTMKIINGEYRFNGKSFLIKEGTITFAGDPEKKTSLYVIASREIEDIKVDIILKGSLKYPAITFRSNPPLSQREILSWILFNRGLSNITSFQGTELNESITNLNTRKSKKQDMLTRIRNQIGIDRIDIMRGEKGSENEVSVQVGKYVSKNLYISVNKSITAEVNRLCLEANLVKNLKMQAAVGDDSQGELLLKWKKDY